MSMNRSLMISAAGHTAVVVLGYFGLPILQKPINPLDSAMVVEIVTISETTNLPTQTQPPKPEQKKAEAPPEPPKPTPPPAPTPVVAPPPPPPPPAPPEPKPPAPPQQVVALPPEPKPEPIPEPKAKPEPAPEPKPQPKVEAAPPKPEPPKPKPVTPPPAEAKPEKKPKEADPFASVLKTVEDLKRSRPVETKPDPKAKPEPKQEPDTKAFEQQIAAALQSKSSKPFDASRPISAQAIDLVREKIKPCWNPPAGGKNAQDIVVMLVLDMNPDGTVRNAAVSDRSRMGDPFYRAAAESAMRAVLNPRCNPLPLPADSYESQWRTLTLNFDPKEMFGT